jgi:hypothetical protein
MSPKQPTIMADNGQYLCFMTTRIAGCCMEAQHTHTPRYTER